MTTHSPPAGSAIILGHCASGRRPLAALLVGASALLLGAIGGHDLYHHLHDDTRIPGTWDPEEGPPKELGSDPSRDVHFPWKGATSTVPPSPMTWLAFRHGEPPLVHLRADEGEESAVVLPTPFYLSLLLVILAGILLVVTLALLMRSA